MPHSHRQTLTQYLIEKRRAHHSASGALNALIIDIADACKLIARRVADGALDPSANVGGEINVQGEAQKALDIISNDIVIDTTQWNGNLAGMVSEELEAHYAIPAKYPCGNYLLVFDPLDGSSNLDVNVTVGSIFSILRAKNPGQPAQAEDFLQRGATQVAAGYALYGPSTMFMLTLGDGVEGFTLDPVSGNFIRTHPNMRIPQQTQEFAINASNSRFWDTPISRYVKECLEGKDGPRGKDFNMRWIASMVAEAHRILIRGGVFLYPRDSKEPKKAGRLRLLYECNPIGMIIEQAGGRASTAWSPILDVKPTQLHQRIGFVFGSLSEVERIERYHQPEEEKNYSVSAENSPLFSDRGLFINR